MCYSRWSYKLDNIADAVSGIEAWLQRRLQTLDEEVTAIQKDLFLILSFQLFVIRGKP